MEPTLVVEGSAVTAAAVGIARRRPRRQPRVRREAIDLEKIAAEFADPSKQQPDAPPATTEPPALEPRPEPVDLSEPPEPATAPVVEQSERTQAELIAALEAEVRRMQENAEAVAPEIEPPPVMPSPVPPAPVTATRHSLGARPVGLPLDELRTWLDQVQADLAKVQARLQFLRVEQARLQEQQHLVAELISSSTPV